MEDPMPIQPCPECQTRAVRWLEASSQEAHVNYYRCEQCGHVWTLSKLQTDAKPNAITRRGSGPATKGGTS